MLERSHAEVVGREVWQVFPRLRGTVFHRAFEDALGDGHLRVVEDRAPPPYARAWYSVTAVPSARGLNVFFRDVTGRRQLERDLLAAEAAQREFHHP
jgi:hypothetical protein